MEKNLIDAMKMTRQIREAHADQIRGASNTERIRFFHEKAMWLNRDIQPVSMTPKTVRYTRIPKETTIS